MAILRALLILLLGAAQGVLAAGQSARVSFLRGQMFALEESSGVRRALECDSHVEVGEIVETGPKALAQLIFSDHSMLNIKADSRVKIDRFQFAGKCRSHRPCDFPCLPSTFFHPITASISAIST